MKILAELSKLSGKQRPATGKELAAVERVIGKLPKDLRALYELAADLDRVAADDGLEWLSPRGGVANYSMQRKIVPTFPASIFPIATDGAGNFACLDTKTGRVVDWDHETRKIKTLTPTLEAFVAKELVAPLRRQTKENASLATSKKIKAGEAPVGLPSKIVQEKAPLLSKVDRAGYGGGAQSIVFLSDDRLFVAFGQSGVTVKLGNKTEQHVSRGGVMALEVASGKRLLSAEFWEIALLDAATCKTLGRWTCEALQHAVDVAIGPDGVAATTDTDGALLLWNLAKLRKGSTNDFAHSFDLPKVRPLASLPGHEGWVFCAFSKDGILASGDAKGRLCLWKGRKLVASTRVAADEIRGVSFSPDGQRLFAGMGSGFIDVRDLHLNEVARWRTPGGAMSHLRVLRSGVVATVDWKLFRLWDPSNGKLLAKIARKRGETSPRVCDERGALVVTTGPAAIYRLS